MSKKSHRIPASTIRVVETPSKLQTRWFLKYRLRNGLEGCYPISASDKDRIEKGLQNTWEKNELSFIEFDSKAHYILIQASQIIFFQFLFEPLHNAESVETRDEEDDDSFAVKFYPINSVEPIVLFVDRGDPDPKIQGDAGEMNNFIFNAVCNVEENDFLSITDQDGETAYFRVSSFSLIEIPREVLQNEEMEEDSASIS